MIRNGTVLAGLILLAGCGSATPPPVLVGHVAVEFVEGENRFQSAVGGVRLAVKQVNRGIAESHEPELRVLHCRAKTTGAVAAEAIRLDKINQVSALLGGWNSRQVEALNQRSLVVVSASGMRTSKLGTNVFLTGISPQTKGRHLAEFAVSRWPVDYSPVLLSVLVSQLMTPAEFRSVPSTAVTTFRALSPVQIEMLVDQRLPESEAAAEAFTETYLHEMAAKFPKLKIPRPQVRRYSTDEELADLSRQLESQPPDVIFVAGSSDALKTVRTHPIGDSIPILYAGPEANHADLLDNGRTAHEIFLVTAWTSKAKTKQNQTFLKRYRDTFDEEPDAIAALAYDNARILFESVRDCDGPISAKVLHEQLSELKDFPLLTGKASFDDHGDLHRPAFFLQLRHGRVGMVQQLDAEK